MPILPSIVAHADWSKDAKKRWVCKARLKGGAYRLSAPEPAGPDATFFQRLRSESDNGGAVVAGFDFPIGLPIAYATAAGIVSFIQTLQLFGAAAPWHEFYERAETPHQISVHRPFYPRRSGGTCHQHLLTGLGLAQMSLLLRRCELRSPTRLAACYLFWTLGGNQVGAAAIAGWRDLLVPASAAGAICLWPFEGTLSDLLRQDKIVVVETYPREAYTHLFFRRASQSASKFGDAIEGRTSLRGPRSAALSSTRCFLIV